WQRRLFTQAIIYYFIIRYIVESRCAKCDEFYIIDSSPLALRVVYDAVTRVPVGLFAAALIVPANVADKMDFRACKFRVMQHSRYLSGKPRNICGWPPAER